MNIKKNFWNSIIAKILVCVLIITNQIGWVSELTNGETDTHKIESVINELENTTQGSIILQNEIENNKETDISGSAILDGVITENEDINKDSNIEIETDNLSKSSITLTDKDTLEPKDIESQINPVDLTTKDIITTPDACDIVTKTGIVVTGESIVGPETKWINLIAEYKVNKEYLDLLLKNVENFELNDEKIENVISNLKNNEIFLTTLREYDGKNLKNYGTDIFQKIFQYNITLKKLESYKLVAKAFGFTIEDIINFGQIENSSNRDEVVCLTENYPDIEANIFIEIKNQLNYSNEEVKRQLSKSENRINSKVYEEMKKAFPDIESYDNSNDMPSPLDKFYNQLTQSEIEVYSIEKYDSDLLLSLENQGFNVNESMFFIQSAELSIFSIDELVLLYQSLNSIVELQKIDITATAFVQQEKMSENHIINMKKLILEGKKISNVINAYNPELENGFDMEIVNRISRTKRSISNGQNKTIDIDKYINQGFAINAGNNVIVNPVSGCMTFSLDIMDLQMNDGTVFPLKLNFNSTKSNTNEVGSDGKNLITGKFSYLVENYSIAPGWGLNLSTFHKDGTYYNEDNWAESYKYMDIDVIHLSDGRDLRVKKIDDRTYKFEDETVKDIRIEVCDTVMKKREFTNRQNFEISRLSGGRWDYAPSLKIIHKDGTIEYFNYDGFLLGQVSKNGNGFRVEYKIDKMGDAEFLYPSKIVTSSQEEITFDFTHGMGVENRIKTPTKEIVINKAIAIDIHVVKDITVLDRIGGVSPQKYSFIAESYYTTHSYGYNQTVNLVNSAIYEIIYPTGAKTKFKYEPISRRSEDGAYIQKITVSDSSNIIDEEVKNHCIYKYTDSNTTLEYDNGKKIDSIFNSDYQTVIQRSYIANDLFKETLTHYNSNKLAEKIDYITYQNGNKKQLSESFKYDSQANIIEHTDTMGALYKYSYENRFNQLTSKEVKINDSKIYRMENIYDSNGNISINKTFNGDDIIIKNYKLYVDGTLNSITIDNNGKVIKTKFANYFQNAAQFGFGPGIIYYRQPGSAQMITEYTEDGVLKRITRLNVFDNNTQEITRQVDPCGRAIDYTYDAFGRITKVIYQDGKQKTIVYDDLNNSYTTKEIDGVEKRTNFDKLGYLISEEIKLNNNWTTIHENEYDDMYRLIGETNGNGIKTSYIYDSKDRVIETRANGKLISSYSYDDINNIKTTTNAEGEYIVETFDNAGRAIKKEYIGQGLSKKISMEYDNVGNLIKKTFSDGKTYQYEYDSLSQLIQVIDPMNQKTKYEYDKLGNLISKTIIDSANNKNYKTSNEYDEIGRLIKTTDEKNRAKLFYYDLNGNVIKTIEKDGSEKTYKYDSMSRAEEESTKDTLTKYNYDKNGRLQKVDYVEDKLKSTNIKTYTYEYDTIGRLIKTIKPDKECSQYIYDNMNNITRYTDYFGLVTDYKYNTRNNLESVSTGGRTIGYSYYDDDLIKTVTYPNGIKTDLTYDGLNQITNINHQIKGRTNSTSYGYDIFGNINSVQNGNIKKSYKYDTLNRLTEVKNDITGSIQTLNYDVRSNIIKETATVDLEKTFRIGNYEWDSQGGAKSFTNELGNKTEYSYDYSGLRETKINNETQTKYYYDAKNRLTNEIVNGQKISVVYGISPLMRIIDGKYYYYMLNGHGDIIELIDESGNKQNEYEYDEWGKLLKSEEKIQNDIKYAGQVYDEESGNYYLRARYYNPEIRRFISKDGYEGTLENPLTQNQYIYCLNNPMNYTDPSGNISELVVIAILEHVVDTAIETFVDVLIDMILDGESFSLIKSAGGGFLINIVPIAGEVSTSKKLAKLSTKYGDDIVLALRNTDEIVKHADEIIEVAKKDGVKGLQRYLSTFGKGIKGGLKIDVDTVINSANAMKKGGESVVGHALQKHAGRNPDIWGKIKGNSAQINETAMNHLDDILSGSGDFKTVTTDKGVKFLEKFLPDGRGVRLNMDGTFKGFID